MNHRGLPAIVPALLLASALSSGCARDTEAHAVEPAPTPIARSEANAPVLVAKADDAGWGTVKGQIVYAGDEPPVGKINVNKDEKHCTEKGDILNEDWVINKKNKGVKWVFVWLSPAAATDKLPIHPDLKDPPKKGAELDQPFCAFVPHCLAIREGQDLIVKNSSPVPHNVNVTGNPRKNAGFNVLLPSGGQVKASPQLKADRFPLQITCNIHPWMNARVAVFDHPYFAVTDEDGNFEIKDAPVGDFNLKVWHAPVGWRGGAAGKDGQKITIKKGGTDLGKVELKAKYDD